MGFLSSRVKRTSKGPSLDFLRKMECRACPLNKLTQNRHPHMKPTGSKHPLVYVLGEAPGKVEDLRGEQFVGGSGELLRARIPKRFLNHIRFNNVVRTRPYNNATPDYVAIECCRPSIETDIIKSKPKAIFGFGNVPLRWLGIGGGAGITEWCGRRIPVNVGGHSCWYYPMLHPSFLLRTRNDWARRKGPSAIGSENERAFVFDMQHAFEEIENLPIPKVHTKAMAEENLEIYDGSDQTKHIKQIRTAIQWAMNEPTIGVDYETNAHRPYNADAQILTVAISSGGVSIAWAVDHPEAKWDHKFKQALDLWWISLLKAPTRKVVHNLMFEHEWTAVKYGEEYVRASPWDCTLMQASTLDERRGERKDKSGEKYGMKGGPLSLDFLCRQHFGFGLKDLSGLDRKYLSKEPLDKVLRYNAMDAKYHFYLWEAQRERLIEQGLQEVFERGNKRIATCVLAQVAGLDVDTEETQRLEKKYDNIIDKSHIRLKKLKVIKKFRKLAKEDFNPDSPDDVAVLLRDVMKRKEGYYTEYKNGEKVKKYSTDKHVLLLIDHPVTKLISRIRKAGKKKSTYLYRNSDDKTVLWPDTKIHCILNPGTFTDTFRLSSEDPNLQNLPKRVEENKEIRKQIIAPPGHSIVTIDYGQIEHRVFAMASKDKRTVKALWDRHDIHADWAKIIARAYPRRIGGSKNLDDPKVMKNFRTDIKNQWTFPALFGAQLPSIAGYLKVPEENITRQYNNFKEEFAGVFKWQEKLMQFYYENGYVENMCGHRRHGPMSRNEAINAPIQSTACEIVMDSMNRISAYSNKKNDPYFLPRLQVHDELLFILPNNNLDRYLDKIITKMVHVPFKFINVPITVEVSMGPNLLDMEEVLVCSSDDWGKS